MTLVNLVAEAMQRFPGLQDRAGMVSVPTHCMFGSGGLVTVYVAGGDAQFVVHDGGGAIDEFSRSGGQFPNAVKMVRSFVKGQGFTVSDRGEITAPLVGFDGLVGAVLLVANAAREASEFLLDRWHPVIRRDFKAALRKLLEDEFPHIRHEVRFAGQSTKQHKFDFVLPAKAGGELLIESVAHEQSAISASVIKCIDVRNASGSHIQQRVIYDDMQEWRAEDLNLLKLGATPVPFSHAQQVIERLAA